MARVRYIQNNFTAGELSPLLFGRTEFVKYDNGLETAKNVLPKKYGGVKGRGGLRFVNEVKDSTKAVRLINFEFNVEQAYIIEIGDLYFRFYRNGGQIISGTPVEVATPYVEADIFELQFAQSADTMWIVHPSYKPRKLTRTSHTAWTFTNYAPGADPFTSTDNYPSTVAFWQERLWFANSNNNPRRIWGTVSGDFEDMTVGTGDDAAFVIDPASGQQNLIRWVSPSRVLLYGTAGDENQLRAASVGQAITPTNHTAIPETNEGSANIQPIRAQNATLFIQRAKRKLRELVFSFDVDGYVAKDLIELSEHLLPEGKSVIQMSYDKEPDSIIYLVRSDGVLLSMTYEKSQDVFAWARQITADNTSDSVIESVASIPHPDGDKDQTWVVVQRTIDGASVRYIEYFDEDLKLDSALSYSGAAVTTISGLDHLEGETVKVVSAGSVLPDEVVASGAIVLSEAVTAADIGLGYVPEVKSLRPEFNVPQGTAQGVTKRWVDLTLWLNETVKEGVTVNDDLIADRDPSIPMGSPPSAVTEDVNHTIDDSFDSDGTFTIKQTLPLPFELLSYFGTIEAHDS